MEYSGNLIEVEEWEPYSRKLGVSYENAIGNEDKDSPEVVSNFKFN